MIKGQDNKHGRRTLLKYLEERGWMIINGRDKEGEEWTYIGERGNSIIDYVIGNQGATEEIIDMKVGKRTESDHMPLEIETVGGGTKLQKMRKRKKKRRKKGNEQTEVWKNIWRNVKTGPARKEQ